MFDCFGWISERDGSISLSNIGGKLSDVAFECLCLIYPVMVYYLPVQRNVWDMELLLWRGWFLSYIVVFQLSRYQKICYKALLWWVSRWKNDCLLKWGDWGPIFFFGRSTEFVKGLLQQKGCVEKWVWAWQRTESGDDVKPYIFSTTFSYRTLLYYLGEWLWEWPGGVVRMLL